MIEHDDPLASGQSAFLLESQKKTLAALLMALSLAAPLITLGVTLREGFSALAGVGASLTLVVWLSLWLFRCERIRLAAHTVVFAVLAASVVGVVAHGTVRSAAVMVMLAGVVAAGSFLPRRTMILAALFSIAALAVLNAMESYGMLRQPNLQVGWALWITQTAVLVSVLVSVFHGRHRTREAFISHERALARATQVESDLRASEARFVGLFRNTPAACLVQDLKTRTVLDVNEAFVKMFGYPREELVGRSPPELWADLGEQLAFRTRLQAEGRVNGLRARAKRSDGSPFDALVFAETITQVDDQLVMSMALDISAEMASRRALEQSEERFSKAFSFSPVGTVICRLRDGTYLEANPSNQDVLGYQANELLGRTSTELNVWISPEDRRTYTSLLHEQGQVLGFATRLRNKQGEAVDVQLWSQVIDLNGEACELAYTINVTEERRREAMLMSVARGVSSKTGEAFFLSLAERLAEGIGAEGVLIGELGQSGELDTLALLQEGDLQPNRTLALAQTTLIGILAQEELVTIDARASQMALNVPPVALDTLQTLSGVALRDPDGSAIGVMAVVWRERRDPTPDVRALLTIFASRCNAELVRLRRDREIRRLQATLEHRVAARTQQLEYLNRELESFSYSVSHDLKSPLRSMDGFTHMLREQMADRLTQEDEDLIVRVQGAIARMNSLITDLLALARVSQGRLQRMEVSLSELAKDVTRSLHHTDPDRDVEVRVQPGLTANCDARMAHIVLENLLGNAWKYTRHQTPALIEMGLEHSTSGPPRFYVRDNGAGFDMSRSERLFKPFNRLHAVTEFEGSGVGLATVRRIIERHGGDIAGTGKPGGGATFVFSFGSGTTG
jgi:PAS domain S-box-containing protein